LVVFDDRDHIGTERGWRNRQLTGGSCFLPTPLAVEATLLVVALNTAAVSNNPPAAAANVIHDLLLATEHPRNRLAEAAAAVVGAIFATEGSGPSVSGYSH